MRVFLNGILAAIGSTSLTDVEFESITLTVQDYSKATYDELKEVLQEREGVSGQLKRLKAYFESKGTDLSGVPARNAGSHILIGGGL